MQWARVFGLAVMVAMLGAACGGDGAAPPAKKVTRSDAGSDEFMCVDDDGDGFGLYCELGTDCDDTDPEITDECRRCMSPKEGCTCKPGTAPVKCDPPSIKVAGGTLVCSEGTRYCRDSAWSACEIIGQYTFVAD
jgi:hypothetical protein